MARTRQRRLGRDFERISETGGVEVFVLREMMEYADAISNVRGWRIMPGATGRYYYAETSVGGETVNFFVRKTRRKGDPTGMGFANLFPCEADPGNNIRKAAFLSKHIRLSTEKFDIRTETPVGFIRRPDGGGEEVYLREVDAVSMHSLGGGLHSVARQAIAAYQTLKGSRSGFYVHNYDMNEGSNLLFRKLSGGRLELIVVDTEFFEVLDLARLKRRVASIDRRLRAWGFDVGRRNIDPSLTGHPVSEALLEASAFMTEEQRKELRSPQVALPFLNALEGYCRRVGWDFNVQLRSIVMESREIVPQERVLYFRNMTRALENSPDERTFFIERGKAEKNGPDGRPFGRVRPIMAEKEGWYGV